MLQVRVIVAVMRALYWRRGWPLRRASEDLCRIAAARGRDHDAKQVYRQYLANFTGVAENYFRLYREGVEGVLEHETKAWEFVGMHAAGGEQVLEYRARLRRKVPEDLLEQRLLAAGSGAVTRVEIA